MKKDKILRISALLCFAALFILTIFLANRGWQAGAGDQDGIGTEYETAYVVDVLADNTVSDEAIEGRLRGSKLLELELRTGRYAGQVVEVPNYFSAMYAVDVKAGNTVSVRIDTAPDGSFTVSVYNYNRVPLIIGLVFLFCAALILIGGWQGLRALLGLGFTFVCIVWILLPLVLQGWPPIPLTVAIVAVTSAVGFYLLGGWQPKTLGALLGALCGVAAAAVLGYLAAELVHVSAYQMDESEGLLLARNDTGLQISGLLLSGILIAAQGAVMDTAMSIASAMAELKEKRPDIGYRALLRSGMVIGRDTTGTMANTLVLAFAGSSLNMMVLIFSYRVSFLQLMNTDFIAVEVVRALAGSLGIIFTVPCVAAITAGLLCRKK